MQDSVTEFTAVDDSPGTYSAGLLLLVLIGFVGIADGVRIIMTKTDTVGSASAGGWIVLLGGLLSLGALQCAVKEKRSLVKGTVPTDAEGEIRLPITALVMLLVYIALIEPLGYTLATLMFMAVYLRMFGKYGVIKIATISIAFTLVTSWLWAAMDMMLPKGIMPWP